MFPLMEISKQWKVFYGLANITPGYFYKLKGNTSQVLAVTVPCVNDVLESLRGYITNPH